MNQFAVRRRLSRNPCFRMNRLRRFSMLPSPKPLLYRINSRKLLISAETRLFPLA